MSELQPPASNKHILVEIDDTHRIIKKAKPTIYTLVGKGQLSTYKKGKKLYFYEDELLAWIENGRRKSAEQTYEEKQILFPDYVGRCDHEQKCGYHFTPRDYFEQNPSEKEKFAENSFQKLCTY